MRKTNLILSLCLLSLGLTACGQDHNVPSIPSESSGGIVFKKVEDPKVVEISGSDLYQKAIEKQQHLAVFYSVTNCGACSHLREQMNAFAIKQGCNIYEINISNQNKEEYNKIVDATSYANDAYRFPAYGSELSLPFMNVFAFQGVVKAFNENFVNELLSLPIRYE